MFLIDFNDDVDYIDVYTIGNVHMFLPGVMIEQNRHFGLNMHNTCKPMSTRFISSL